MSKRYFRKLACLAKIEALYGNNAAPTGAANAIQMSDVTFTPMAGSEEGRGLMLPHLGNQGVELTGNYVQLEAAVEIAGSGQPGLVPAYGALMRGCGLSETVEDGVAVEYQPVSEAHESVSIYFIQDGVKHVMLGCRGNVTVSLTPQQIPRFRFTMQGLLGTISDDAMPAVDLKAFIRPLIVNSAHTQAELHGWPAIAGSLSIDLGNQVAPYFMIGAESIEIGDRSSTGTAVVEATGLATMDWFDRARKRTSGTLTARHGITAGNIFEVEAPKVEIGRPTQGQTQGVLNYSLPLGLVPDAGDDEIIFRIR